MLRSMLLAALVLPISLFGAAQDTTQRLRHPWARWQIGSTVTTRNDALNSLNTVTLKAVNNSLIVLHRVETIRGKPARDQDETDRLGLLWPPADPAAKLVGKETLLLGGKAFSCEVWEFSLEQPYPEYRKYWISKELDVPLKVVLRSSLSGYAKHSIELVASKLDVKVAVGNRFIPTVQLDGTLTFDSTGKQRQETWWLSPEVPGLLVRVQRVSESNVAVSTVIAFDARK